MKKLFWFALVLLSSTLSAQTKEIKLATIAPAGSSWGNITDQMNAELKSRTGGKLALRIYPGGTQGDEKDVIRKMRIGQIHAGGFTGFGLGMITSAVRALELPVLYQTYEEVDYVETKIQPQMEALFLKGNPPVVLLGWSEAGFVYIFSKQPIKTVADLRASKAWLWEGDPQVGHAYKSLGVDPIPLAVPDVMTALSTNMVNAVYAPPLGALALQWSSKVSYMLDFPLGLSAGGFVMLKSEFDKLSPDQQKILKEVAAKYCREMIVQTRKDNQQAIEEMKRLGIKVIPVAENDRNEFSALMKKIWTEQIGQLYTAEQLQSIQQFVTEARSKGQGAAAQLH